MRVPPRTVFVIQPLKTMAKPLSNPWRSVIGLRRFVEEIPSLFDVLNPVYLKCPKTVSKPVFRDGVCTSLMVV
ncbi:hypothetical protein Y032_0236g3226 [Ancylostoma ceylanicum]|uniref:Uncharacterized protein n=1 Tax=Ancylostoma ceylanicum TaxID=53326 RepID=A0A016SEW0_9BILA|nr:hypothetical protein Y032_0236g3226 [Ancylostoma ceylanicum]